MRRTFLNAYVFFTLVVIAHGAAHAELRATITPRIVDEMETVRLTLRASDTRRTEKLDLTPLHADFEVLGTQTSSQYHSINGRVESFVEYQINLRPKRSGEITIPPIDIGGESNRPLNLTVRALDPGVKQAIDRMVFFETEVSPNPVYVQAQTVLTRRLFYSNGVQIYSDLPGTPEVPDAVVVPLGDTRSLNMLRDGQRYGIIEQRFAIYPERSGTLTIPAIAVTSSVRVQSGDRIRRSGVRIGTEEIIVEVLPIPSSYPADQPWLPATRIRMNDTWTPDIPSYEIGDPVTRAVMVLATDNVGSAIPPLAVTLPESNFRLYPETPVLQDDSSGDTVIGARLENFSIIPTSPGLVDIPPIELTWWDTQNKRVRVSQLAGITVEISGTVATAPPTPALETPTALRSEIASEPESQTSFATTSLITSKTTLLLLAQGRPGQDPEQIPRVDRSRADQHHREARRHRRYRVGAPPGPEPHPDQADRGAHRQHEPGVEPWVVEGVVPIPALVVAVPELQQVQPIVDTFFDTERLREPPQRLQDGGCFNRTNRQ